MLFRRVMRWEPLRALPRSECELFRECDCRLSVSPPGTDVDEIDGRCERGRVVCCISYAGARRHQYCFFRLRRREAELAARQCVTRWDRDLPWKTPLLNHSGCEQVDVQRVEGSRNSLSIQIQGARFLKNQFKRGKKEACCGGLACVRGCWWATIVRGVLRLGTAGSCKPKRGEGTIIISGPARVWVLGR